VLVLVILCQMEHLSMVTLDILLLEIHLEMLIRCLDS